MQKAHMNRFEKKKTKTSHAEYLKQCCMPCIKMYKDFGFGRDRCAKALKSMTEIVEHSDTDEVFWEHIDRVVIDKLKLEFDKRDYTDNGKVVNFEGARKGHGK